MQLRGGSRDDDDDDEDDHNDGAKGNPYNAPREAAGPVPPTESTIVCGTSFLPVGSRGEAASAQKAARHRRSLQSVPIIGPSLPPPTGHSAAAAADDDDAEDAPATPMSASELPASYAIKVAVGLKQELVEIAVTPHTTWETAKQLACAAASGGSAGLDPAVRIHSLTLSPTSSLTVTRPLTPLFLLFSHTTPR